MKFKGLKTLVVYYYIFLTLYGQSYEFQTQYYILILRNQVGTNVLSEYSTKSALSCASICNAVLQCVGYTWTEMEGMNCVHLKSLHETSMQENAAVYIKLPYYRIIETRYPMANYGVWYGKPPMILDCSPGGSGTETGILVGLASRNDMDDLDYMICADFPQVTIDLSDGAAFDIHTNKSWSRGYFVTAIYGTDQQFYRPSTFTYKIRGTVNVNPTMSGNCISVDDNSAPIRWTFPLDQKELKSWRICPPQMYISSLYRNPSEFKDFRIHCCSLKYT